MYYDETQISKESASLKTPHLLCQEYRGSKEKRMYFLKTVLGRLGSKWDSILYISIKHETITKNVIFTITKVDILKTVIHLIYHMWDERFTSSNLGMYNINPLSDSTINWSRDLKSWSIFSPTQSARKYLSLTITENGVPNIDISFTFTEAEEALLLTLCMEIALHCH